MKAKITNIDYIENLITLQVLGALNGLKQNDLFEIKKVRRKRTLDQNSLYWLFCDFVGMALGMTKEEIHSGFSGRLLVIQKEANGKIFKTIRSTADLDVNEFIDYIDRCNLIALEYSVDTSPFWEEYEKFKKTA